MIVRGTAQWASVFEPNELSGKFQIDICNLNTETVKALKSVGIDPRKGTGEKADKGRFITAKSKKYPPKVLDRRAQVMDGSILIGNGSEVKVSIRPYAWTFGDKSGVGAGLNSVMVITLIEYGGGEELEPEDDFGDNEVPFDTEEGIDEL